jgi:hypothetical protein
MSYPRKWVCQNCKNKDSGVSHDHFSLQLQRCPPHWEVRGYALSQPLVRAGGNGSLERHARPLLLVGVGDGARQAPHEGAQPRARGGPRLRDGDPGGGGPSGPSTTTPATAI